MKKHAQFLLIPWLILLTADLASARDITVKNAWIREAPPAAQRLAAYMVIENNSTHAIALDSASSPDFRMVEIHRTKMDNGIAHMIKQTHVKILPGESLTLEPGSYHLMLMQPLRSLRAGDTVRLSLHFANSSPIDITATVRKDDK